MKLQEQHVPKNLTPQCNCQYGAPMGRSSWDDNKTPFRGRMYLQRIRLNSGGYDAGGAYWGVGEQLYGYASWDDSVYGFVRAYDRQDAKQRVLARYPGARFYN